MQPHTEPLTTLQLSVQSGVSLRQLQHWDESGLVSPRMEGHRRLYDPADSAKVKLIAALRQKRMSLQAVRRAVSKLPEDAAFVLTDGSKVTFANDERQAFTALIDSDRPMVIVPLSKTNSTS